MAFKVVRRSSSSSKRGDILGRKILKIKDYLKSRSIRLIGSQRYTIIYEGIGVSPRGIRRMNFRRI